MLEFTDANFQTEVLESDRIVLVDFWAPWCAPCHMVTPILVELSEEYKDTVRIGKVNVDENVQIASQFNIRGIPTLLLFKDGAVVDQIVGASPKENIARMMGKYL